MEIALIVSSVLLWPMVVCNVLLTLALVRRLNRMGTGQSSEMGLKAGEAAPDFTAQTLGGATKTLADYTNQAVAFIFLATGCKPCRDRLPMLEKIGPEVWASGVELVLVSGDGLEETQALREEMNLQLPLLIAPRPDNSFFDDYKVPGTPAFCLINAEGKVHRASILGPEFPEWKQLVQTKPSRDRQTVLTGN